MEITQQVRDYARAHALSEDVAVKQGLDDKASEFREGGGDLYR
jgi:phosphomethylpyrimidine synthase